MSKTRDALNSVEASTSAALAPGAPVISRKKPRYLLRTVQALLFLILLGLGYCWWWANRSPTIRRNYIAELNAPTLAADHSSLAWPEIRAALKAMPQPPATGSIDFAADEAGLVSDRSRHRSLEVQDYVRSLQPMLDRVRSAAKRPRLGFLLRVASEGDPARGSQGSNARSSAQAALASSETSSLASIQQEHLSVLRVCASYLGASTWQALADRHADQSIANIEAIFNLSRLCREDATREGVALSMFLDERALEFVSSCLERAPSLFGPAELLQMDLLVSEHAGKQSLNVMFARERLNFEDYLQRAFTDDGKGNGSITLKGVYATRGMIPFDTSNPSNTFSIAHLPRITLAALFVADRKSQLARYDQYFAEHRAAAAVPPWEYAGGKRSTWMLVNPRGWREELRYEPIQEFIPAIEAMYGSHLLLQGQVAATRAIIAIHRSRAENGDWPVSLSELVPSFLESVPKDCLDGKPLRYVVREGMPMVYSIGTNRVDDGGRAASLFMTKREWIAPHRIRDDARLNSSGLGWDLIYFPPSKAVEMPLPTTQQQKPSPT